MIDYSVTNLQHRNSISLLWPIPFSITLQKRLQINFSISSTTARQCRDKSNTYLNQFWLRIKLQYKIIQKSYALLCLKPLRISSSLVRLQAKHFRVPDPSFEILHSTFKSLPSPHQQARYQGDPS